MQPIAELRRRVGRALQRGSALDAGATEERPPTSDRPGAPAPSRRPEVVEAEALLARGEGPAAVDLLAAANRRTPDPELQIALVDVRRRAAEGLEGESPAGPWPPAYDDPFPDVSGEIPAIDRDGVDVAAMAGAVAHHGALIVRRLFDDAQVAAVREVIDLAHAAHADGAEGGGPDSLGAAFRPMTTSKPRLTADLRAMVARDGGVWLADSPRATAVAIDALRDAGVIDVMTEHFGSRPVFSLQKSTLRRSQPVRKLVGWHQDGSFYDPDVRTMNVWVALSPCGGDRPAPGLEIVPRRMEEILPVAGVPTKHSVDYDLVERIAEETPTVFPSFDAGDAIVFDEHLLHRTHLPEGMTEPRYALECWFFAPSAHTSDYVPLLV